MVECEYDYIIYKYARITLYKSMLDYECTDKYTDSLLYGNVNQQFKGTHMKIYRHAPLQLMKIASGRLQLISTGREKESDIWCDCNSGIRFY